METFSFDLVIGFLQGQTVKETKQEIIDKGLTVYMVRICWYFNFEFTFSLTLI